MLSSPVINHAGRQARRAGKGKTLLHVDPINGLKPSCFEKSTEETSNTG
jgi:hypothetical protein